MTEKDNRQNHCGECCWFYAETTDGDGLCAKRGPADVRPEWYEHGMFDLSQGEPPADGIGCTCDDAACWRFTARPRLRHALAVLTAHNRWRRDTEHAPSIYRMQNPTELGRAIDLAVDYCKTFMDK